MKPNFILYEAAEEKKWHKAWDESKSKDNLNRLKFTKKLFR